MLNNLPSEYRSRIGHTARTLRGQVMTQTARINADLPCLWQLLMYLLKVYISGLIFTLNLMIYLRTEPCYGVVSPKFRPCHVQVWDGGDVSWRITISIRLLWSCLDSVPSFWRCWHSFSHLSADSPKKGIKNYPSDFAQVLRGNFLT